MRRIACLVAAYLACSIAVADDISKDIEEILRDPARLQAYLAFHKSIDMELKGHWEYVGEGLDGSGFEMRFISKDRRLVTEQGMVTAWVRTELSTSQQGVRSLRTRTEFDCRAFRSRTVAIAAYSDNNLGGDVLGSHTLPAAEWNEMPPGTVGEVTLTAACKDVKP